MLVLGIWSFFPLRFYKTMTTWPDRIDRIKDGDEMKAPRTKHQAPEKFQTSRFNSRDASWGAHFDTTIGTRNAAVSSSTSRSALLAQMRCGWSATQPRSHGGCVRMRPVLGFWDWSFSGDWCLEFGGLSSPRFYKTMTTWSDRIDRIKQDSGGEILIP